MTTTIFKNTTKNQVNQVSPKPTRIFPILT